MKRNIITKGVLALAMAGFLGSCADDYLDTLPVTQVTDKTAMSSYAGANEVLQGIFESMNVQYAGMSLDVNCGQGTMNAYFGEVIGQDYVNGRWTGNPNFDMSTLNGDTYNCPRTSLDVLLRSDPAGQQDHCQHRSRWRRVWRG